MPENTPIIPKGIRTEMARYFSLPCFWGAIALAVLAIGWPGNSDARETITWVNENFPPAFIIDGPDKGNGITDGVVDIYKELMPEYDHRHMVANIARILDLIKNGEKVCYAGFIKTAERERFIAFSLPNIITYANALIVTKKKSKAIVGMQTSANLSALLDNRSFTLGLTKGRAYGGPIDSLLRDHPARDNILFRGGQNELLGLLEMLDRDRIQATIGYPWEVAYLGKQIGKRHQYAVIPIQETKGHRWVLSYAGCPNTSWGRQFIRKLNTVLIKARPMDRYIHHLLKWYPLEMEADMRKAYTERVLSVKK